MTFLLVVVVIKRSAMAVNLLEEVSI